MTAGEDPDPEEEESPPPPPSTEHAFTAAADAEGVRLDRYLGSRLPDLSRASLQRLIHDGSVTVNDAAAKPASPLHAGDRVLVRVRPPAAHHLKPEPIPLSILYEDRWLAVLDKQAGLSVHPAGRGDEGGTIVNGLLHHFGRLSGLGGPLRPGIVHRLDRDTSGVLLVAKDESTHFRLARQFHDRQVEKEYLAVVQGEVERDADVIDAPIGRNPRTRETMRVDPRSGRDAVTAYEVVERFRGYTHLRVLPRTGRTHQLRVHLQWIGHPCVADAPYGRQKVLRAGDLLWPAHAAGAAADRVVIARQALHARRLACTHPESGARLELSAPVPADLQDLLDLLRRLRSK
jgi:23S rRNA pseudouridine1911/1915/1917 synthase